jgi:hypothetical protein
MQKDETQQSYAGQEQAQKLADRMVSQVENLPLNGFLMGAALSVGAALILRLMRRERDALFVGQWAPTLLLVGLYAKSTSGGITREGFRRRTEAEREEAMH